MKSVVLCLCLVFVAAAPSVQKPAAKLLIAFASYRDRPKYPHIYFYQHDGVATGKIIGAVGTPKGIASAEGQPSLSHDGRYCAFTYEIENKTSRISCWDLKEQKFVELPVLNDSETAVLGPSFSANGNLIAFTTWNRRGGPGPGWHVFLFDRSAKKLTDLPGLNSQAADDRMPALSGDGRWVAFASNRKGGMGLTDIYLYDRQAGKGVLTPGLNSPFTEVEPSLNADGSLTAFASERPHGAGGRDIYLFNRVTGTLVPSPTLNTLAQEYSPRLSPDGRFLVFVSERVDGQGERDVYLYDRDTERLLPTPGLNSKTEDFDPTVIVLTGGD
jgi:Tol biopolymer transport system component